MKIVHNAKMELGIYCNSFVDGRESIQCGFIEHFSFDGMCLDANAVIMYLSINKRDKFKFKLNISIELESRLLKIALNLYTHVLGIM